MMDYIRFPYDIPARFFSDDEQEHTLRWRPASEGADVFPEPHKFGSLFNGYFNWADGSHVGEVFKGSEPRRGLRAVNRWFNNRPALGYDVGLTPCEPLESFRTGEMRDDERPPALYNEDGFPRCCLDRSAPRIGVKWGMRALTTVTPVPPSDCIFPGDQPFGQWLTFIIPAGVPPFCVLSFGGTGPLPVNVRFRFEALSGTYNGIRQLVGHLDCSIVLRVYFVTTVAGNIDTTWAATEEDPLLVFAFARGGPTFADPLVFRVRIDLS